jgi:hypothetical protein
MYGAAELSSNRFSINFNRRMSQPIESNAILFFICCESLARDENLTDCKRLCVCVCLSWDENDGN